MLSGPVLKQFRTYLKSQVGNGWSVEGRKSKGRLLTRVSFRYLSGERSVVLLDIDFDAENQDDIVRTVKKLSDLMRERNIELSKAKELLCGGKVEDNGKAGINWKALQDEFINLERGDRRKTTLTGLKLRMERILECFEAKPKPRNSEQLFRKYAELHFGESMPKGGMGRKRDMGDIRAFLNWAVLEKKYLAMEWLPITPRQCRKYIGAVSKNSTKTKVRQPISTRDLEMLLEALERDKEYEMRGLVILYSVFGIRPCEIAKLEIKDGVAQVTTLKQNEKTMYEEPEVRTIAPLNLPNLPNEGERVLSLYESGKLKFPSRIEKVIAKHNDKNNPFNFDLDGYKPIGEKFGKLLAEFWFWKELKKKNPNYVAYSFRHSFAWRGSMETSPALPLRTICAYLGHDESTHLKHYGHWTSDAENKKRIEEANKNIVQNCSLAHAL